jgi:predicted glycoside hydrolase/deacetylase ChbG (UPF0249 family)
MSGETPNPVPNNAPRTGAENSAGGILIVNADDWGRDRETTDRTLDCVLAKAVSSVSAMVFMEDSERAAAMALEQGVDAGLHLNFTTAFSAGAPVRLAGHQQRLARFLYPISPKQALFNPGLANSFEYAVKAQLEEFHRLYSAEPERIDGHHHMHLCTNVLLARLLPAGTIVRRNFSFRPGEKSWANRLYRAAVDRALSRRHRMTDFFYCIQPMHPAERLQRIVSVARDSVVELETHPVDPVEHDFLAGGEIFRWAGDVPIASYYALPGRNWAGQLGLLTRSIG